MANIDASNYYKRTKCNWKAKRNPPAREPDYISQNGSIYWIERDRVWRLSDHWNKKMGDCQWTLDGKEYFSMDWHFISRKGKRTGVKLLGFAYFSWFKRV